MINTKAELKKKFIEEQLPVSLDGLEKLLTGNKGGDGYFVGDAVSTVFLISAIYPTSAIILAIITAKTRIQQQI